MVERFGDFIKGDKNLVEYRAFNISVQGASHIKKNKVCQDSSGSYDGEKYKIAIICDGHGGDDYFRSEYGSKFAVDAAMLCLQDKELISFFQKNKVLSKKTLDTVISQVEKSIISIWNQAVSDHYDANPITPEELENVSAKAKGRYLTGEKIESIYGTTLIAAMVFKNFWFAIQIGDGRCVILDQNGNWVQPIPKNDLCFLNQTTSMCDSNAFDNFRYCYGIEIPTAVFVGSDGVEDCFGYEDDAALNNFYRVVLSSFCDRIFNTAVDELTDYLPRLSAKGSGDDISISGIVNSDAAKEYFTRMKNASEQSNQVVASNTDDEIDASINNADEQDLNCSVEEDSVKATETEDNIE